jgi:hypothetical protein
MHSSGSREKRQKRILWNRPVMCWTRSRSRTRQHSRHAALVGNRHHMEEESGFLLIDARNAFNEGNRTGMLWTVRHEWPPPGARFAFNCYRHWAILVIRGNNGTGISFTARKVSHREAPLQCLCMVSALSHSATTQGGICRCGTTLVRGQRGRTRRQM